MKNSGIKSQVLNPKTLSNISALITGKSSKNSNISKAKKRRLKRLKKHEKSNTISEANQVSKNLELHLKSNKNTVSINQNTSQAVEKNAQQQSKKKLKRLQNKLNQQVEKPNEITPDLEKHVIKDLLNVQYPKKLNKTVKSNLKESLRERLQNQLKSSRFRYLNEQLYTTKGKAAKHFFQRDPDSFGAYHEGFKQQVAKWPMNPLEEIIRSVRKMSKDKIIADFGCGEAKLARSVPQKVYSFDLLETVPGVIACDMANCKLPSDSIDVAVYCLSLMGTNLRDFIIEANRVLKIGGILKIAEVESRFAAKNVDGFIKALKSFGFTLIKKNLSYELFYFLDFKKENNIEDKSRLPTISLNPCLYKKR